MKSSSHDNSFLRYICFGIPQTWFPLCTSIAFFNSFVLINYPHLKPMVKTFTKNSDCQLPYLVKLPVKLFNHVTLNVKYIVLLLLLPWSFIAMINNIKIANIKNALKSRFNKQEEPIQPIENF